MSVILRNHPSPLSSSTGIEDGFPPGDVEILRYNEMDQKVQILWSDPDDTIINGSTISVWAGTILVRNDNHYPINVEDGILVINNTTKNAYKESYFEDTGLTNGVTYYYRFFPYSTEGVYNNSGNLVFKATPSLIAPVLENNSWETIVKIANTGQAQDYWNIGDTKHLQFNNVSGWNANVVFQIYDFNHFDKTDGSGKANIVFGSKDILHYMSMGTSSGKQIWRDTNLRSYINSTVYNNIPSPIKENIKQVTVKSINSQYDSEDYIFIPSIGEVIDAGKKDGPTFPIFSDNASRTKTYFQEGNNIGRWWLRSRYWYTHDYFYVEDNGYIDTDDSTSSEPSTIAGMLSTFGMVLLFNL